MKLSLIFLFLILRTTDLPAWAMAGIDAIPQSPLFHAASMPDEALIPRKAQEALVEDLKDRFYSPWRQNRDREGEETLMWVFNRYGKGGIFGENLRPRDDRWTEAMRRACRIDWVDESGLKGISLRETSLRLMPTDSPAFLSPDLPGEGYPFDYLQNSTIHPGEPLYLSHLSEDGLWWWCDASFASGWIKAQDLATMGEDDLRGWMSMDLAVLTEDTVIRDGENSLFEAKTGTMLPILEKGATTVTVAVPLKKEDGSAKTGRAVIGRDRSTPIPARPSPWIVARMAQGMIDEPYGWGGFLGNRDCSAMTRDLMLPLGIWLPRNSRAQCQTGEVLSLEGLPGKEKSRIILEKAVPFLTLLGQPGHVMLYVGSYRGSPVIMHNLWGIRTSDGGKEGRFVVGRCVLSTLDVGSDLPNHEDGRLILDRIDRMVFPWRR